MNDFGSKAGFEAENDVKWKWIDDFKEFHPHNFEDILLFLTTFEDILDIFPDL